MKYEPFIPRFKGDKISLCPFNNNPKYLPVYLEGICNENINAYIGYNSKSLSWYEEEEFIKKKRGNMLNIVHNETHELIGSCELTPGRGNRIYEFAICIYNEDDCSKGYGYEALRLLQQYAFLELDALKIELNVYANNPRAIKCYTKAGFEQCGVWHKAAYVHGVYVDLVLMECFVGTFLENYFNHEFDADEAAAFDKTFEEFPDSES